MHDHTHSHSSSDPGDSRYKETARVTLLGAACNILLALVKCVAGWFGNSHALLADGVHSFADLIADALVLVASKFGNQKADEEHPYGHERIETAATIAVAAFLLFAALSIIVDGAQHILSPNHNPKIHWYVLVIAIAALLMNEVIYRITLYIAKKIKSDMLVAHAWHRRSDAATSLIVLLGIIGAMIGFPYLDGVAAIVVGLFILRISWKMGKASFEELIDRGLDEADLQKMREEIQAVEGVKALHQLRTRLMAGNIIADVHVIVAPFLSVSEGHYIGDHVYKMLKANFPNLADVTVHVDAEDDETDQGSSSLPSRNTILTWLTSAAATLPGYHVMQIQAIHYVQKKLTVELRFPLVILQTISKEALQAAYEKALTAHLTQMSIDISFS